MIYQLNNENQSVVDYSNIVGFQHHDAMWFDTDKHYSYRQLAIDLINKYKNAEYILELGCGAGSLSHWMRKFNPKTTIITLDINKDAFEASPYLDKNYHLCIRTDIDYTLSIDKINPILFDLIVSYEHLEHIPEATLSVFIDNIVKHSKKGTILEFSAANWSYPVHPTVKTKEEWDALFVERGYITDNNYVLNHINKPFNFELIRTIKLKYEYTNNR